MGTATLGTLIADLRLIDHHCHGVVTHDLDRTGFEALMTESAWGPGPGLTCFDSPVGLAVRRRCAPVLGLEAGASPEDYLARRADLGWRAVSERLLRGTGVGTLLVETGYGGDDTLGVEGMAGLTGDGALEVVRLEAVAERVMGAGVAAAEFAGRYVEALAAETANAVAVKSIAAYRYGLDFDPERPSEAEVTAAVGRWADTIERGGPIRLEDPVLLRFVIWAGVDLRLPIQLHVGYGDPDIELHRCNPLLMTRWLRATRESGTPVLLLHCYPYQREAGYLAQSFPHVYCDVGLAINYTGAQSATVIGESLELAPFHKVLYSSDAFGLPELHYLGAYLFRAGLERILSQWVERGDASVTDAERIARLVGAENAERVYGLQVAR